MKTIHRIISFSPTKLSVCALLHDVKKAKDPKLFEINKSRQGRRPTVISSATGSLEPLRFDDSAHLTYFCAIK